jgi:hypothetical protein
MKNRAFNIPFKAAFFFAESIALRPLSMPITSFTSPAKWSATVPTPQYRSNRVSSLQSAAYLRAFSYKASAAFVFTWKNASAGTLKNKPFILMLT